MKGELEGTLKAGSERRTELGVRLLALPIALTLAALGWQAWHAYASFRTHSELRAHYVETENFRTLAHALESRKQMSVQIGAEAAQPLWFDYYHNSVSSLEAALDRAIASASDHPAAAKILDRVRILHRTVTGWEKQLILLVLAGDVDGAAKMLLASDYIRDRAEFKNSVDAAVHAIREDAELAMREDQHSEIFSFAISAMLVVLAVVGWVLLLKRLDASRTKLSREVDQRIQAEAQLRQAQKMEAVARLAGGVAHDFKNVLVIIGGNLRDAMARLGQRHPAASSLKSAKDAADQAQVIIRNLLALGRRSSVARTPINAKSMIVDTAQLLTGLLPASIEVSVEADPDCPLWLLADRAQLEQSLVNLALNARDAMPQGGRLTFRAFGKSVSDAADPLERVCLEVIDTGVGMTPEVLKEAFEPFFTTRPKEWGSGLGLSIVQNVVANHGGTVEIASQAGEGTKVSLCLPAGSPSLTDSVSSSALDAHLAKGTAIIIQKSPYLSSLVAETLREEGFQILQVDKDHSIFDVISQEKQSVRLVILELATLGSGVPGTIAKLRAVHGSISIIVVVTGASPEEAVNDFSEGVVVLCQPFPMSELVRLARQLVAKSVQNDAITQRQ